MPEVQFKVDLNKAYMEAVSRLRKRIADSTIPGSMLDDNDVQKIVDDMVASIFEFALLSYSVNPSSDDSSALHATLKNVTSSIVLDFERIVKTVRSAQTHDRPAPTN